MDKLTQQELEEYWALAFSEEDATTCFAIDEYYSNQFGYAEMHAWVLRRL